jgi:hypothetical protein
MDDDYDETISKLNMEVRQITSTNVAMHTTKTGTFFVPTVILKSSILFYICVPLIIVFVLFFFKPKLIMKEDTIIDKESRKKISFKKLILTTIIVSAIITICMFVYSYRKKVVL